MSLLLETLSSQIAFAVGSGTRWHANFRHGVSGTGQHSADIVAFDVQRQLELFGVQRIAERLFGAGRLSEHQGLARPSALPMGVDLGSPRSAGRCTLQQSRTGGVQRLRLAAACAAVVESFYWSSFVYW